LILLPYLSFYFLIEDKKPGCLSNRVFFLLFTF